MQCMCGFNYATTSLDALKRNKPRPFESFLVVHDKDFPAYIQAELDLRQVKEESDAYYAAFGEAAQYAGWLFKCPQCQTLLLSQAGGEVAHYVPATQPDAEQGA